MPDKIITFKCDRCGKPSEKKLKDWRRTEKRGGTQCCSMTCSQKLAHERRGSLHPFRYYSSNANRKQMEAIRKNIKPWLWEYDIDADFCQELFERQNGKCFYTQKDLILPDYPKRGHYWSKPHIRNASLDRIDSKKGYNKDNVRFVCLGVNKLKSVHTDKEVLEFFQ